MADGDHASLAVVPPVIDAVQRDALEHLNGVLEGEAAVLDRAVAFVLVECNLHPAICVLPEIIFVAPEIAVLISARHPRRRRSPAIGGN